MPYCGTISPAANDPASRPSVIGDTKKFRWGSRWFEGAFRLPGPRLGYCAARISSRARRVAVARRGCRIRRDPRFCRHELILASALSFAFDELTRESLD